jgi:hypothetical protein
MGWLFAVSLGMQEGDRKAVLKALPPIALGHEASLAVVATLVIGLEVIADPAVLHLGAAIALVAFGIFRFVKPRAHFRWVKARVNRKELTMWSFLMSTAHGAGLMVAPVLIGVGAAGDAAASDHASKDLGIGTLSIPESALGLVLHVGAMLGVMAVVALVVYDRFGVKILRSTWVNTDAIWASAFIMAGVVTFFT